MNKYSSPDETLPLEWFLYDKICPTLAPVFYEKLKLTPNMITLLGGVMSIFGIRALKNKNFTMFTIFIILRQILDGLDGYVARKYNHSSRYGEILDHAIDEITIFSIILITWRHLNFPRFIIFIFVGAIQTYFQDKRLKCLQNKDGKCLRKTRMFSCFDNLIFLIIIIYLLYNI